MTHFYNFISRIKRHQIFFLMLVAFMLSYPVTYNLNSQVLIGVLVFFFIDTKANIINKLKTVRRNKIVFVFILYFSIQLVGLTYTQDIKRGTDILTRLLPFLFLPTIIISEKLSPKNIDHLLQIMTVWILLIMVYLSINQVFVEKREIGTMVHFAFEKLQISQHYVSIIVVLSIMFCLHKVVQKEKVFVYLAILLALVFFLLQFSSRSSLIILIFSFTIYFLKNIENKSSVFKLASFSLIFLFALAAFFSSSELQKKTNIFISTTDFDIDIVKTKHSITFVKNTIEQRVMINISSLAIIRENPILGVGTGDYLNALLSKYDEFNFIAGKKERFNAHNQYLEDYIKVGILGFLAVIFLIFTILKQANKNKSFMLYCAFAVSFMFLFESFLDRHHGTVFIAFFIPFFYKYEAYKI